MSRLAYSAYPSPRHTDSPIEAVTSPASTGGLNDDVPQEDSDTGPSWLHQSPKGHPAPYDFVTLHMQAEGQADEDSVIHRVEFFPFVGPLARLGGEQWSTLKDHVAMVGGRKVMVASISDNRPFQIEWTYTCTAETRLNDVAWSFNPFTMEIILAAAGVDGVIYLFDVAARTCYKTLKGHGGEVYALAFAPGAPHVLASASADHTVRLWNVTGQAPSGNIDRDESENYPQGDGREGTQCFAILAGGSGGHKEAATALSFHPEEPLIASGGADHQIKIWLLPKFPDPLLFDEIVGDDGDPRHLLIYAPLFSTDSIHSAPVDSLEWLSTETIISRSHNETMAWYWTDHARYPFELLREQGPSRDSWRTSSTFEVLTDFKISSAAWYWRFGVHHAWSPTRTQTLVISTLMAYPIKSSPPAISFFDVSIVPPCLNSSARDFGAEWPERPTTPEVKEEPAAGTRYRPVMIAEDPILDGSDDDESVLSSPPSAPSEISEHVAQNNTSGLPSLLWSDHAPRDGEAGISRQSNPVNGARTDIPKPVPWRLAATAWKGVIQQSRMNKTEKMKLEGMSDILRHVAISPRGAKWMVAVGVGHTAFIWRLRGTQGVKET